MRSFPLLGISFFAFAATVSFAACSSSSNSTLPTDDDAAAATTNDGAAPPKDSGITGARDTGTSPGDSGGACGVRVNSGVAFTDAGAVYCAANMPCDLTKDTCCVGATGAGTCNSGHNGCGGGTLAAAFECVEDTDCPANNVCCGYAMGGMAGSKCQDISASPDHKCSPAPSSTQGSVQFCQKTCECKDGSECIPQSCTITGAVLPAALTMCGLQGAPYNCTPR
jgi:hypothetical protein